MKKQPLTTLRHCFVGALSLLAIASCSIDDKYDLSKDLDMTIGVGKGLALPIGSTEKIMLTELIDTVDSDVVKIDMDGYYSVYSEGTFEPQSFEIDDVDVELDPKAEQKHYDFDLIDYSAYEDLPEWIKQQMMNQMFPYVVYNEVDYVTSFDVDQSVPEEIKKLRSMRFKEPVKMLFELEVMSENNVSDDLLMATNEVALCSDEADGFIVNVPNYIVFEEKDSVDNGRIVLKGKVKYDASRNAMIYSKEYTIVGLDFTKMENGYLEVNDGQIVLHDEMGARGYFQSDIVVFKFENITHIQSVDFKPSLSIGTMQIAEVEGIFEPTIDPISEEVDLNLGDDMDFLNDAYLDFTDPRIFVTFSNPVDASIIVDAEFAGYDKSGAMIDGSKVWANLDFPAATTTNFCIKRDSEPVDGYTVVEVPELNNMLKKIPDNINVNIDARMDNTKYTTISLGKTMHIEGDYQVSVPMAFESFDLVYTEKVEDIFGDDNDITDYVTDINSITVTFDVYNTTPAKFVPSIVAYDKRGRQLDAVTAEFIGEIAKGDGMKDGAVSAPVKSPITIKLSAKNGQLKDLQDLDIKFAGSGSGVFNANEYIQIKDIVVTIDEQISVDLN